MSTGLIPRLVVRLRSSFPDASVECLGTERLNIVLGPQSPRTIVVTSQVVPVNSKETFHVVQATMRLKFPCLDTASEVEYHRLISAENYGLRGVTVLPDETELGESRSLLVRSSFLGFKGRTKDEAENALIDILTLVRFARLLEDRVLRSSVAGSFCFEMYQSQYLSKSGLRNRYINYARTVFRGSHERIFGEVTRMLTEDHGYQFQTRSFPEATLMEPGKDGVSFHVRTPDEIPMLVFVMPIATTGLDARRLFQLANKWNEALPFGHFETGYNAREGTAVLSFVCWKHMTNDLRLYTMDHIVRTLNEARNLVQSIRTPSSELNNERAHHRSKAERGDFNAA